MKQEQTTDTGIPEQTLGPTLLRHRSKLPIPPPPLSMERQTDANTDGKRQMYRSPDTYNAIFLPPSNEEMPSSLFPLVLCVPTKIQRSTSR